MARQFQNLETQHLHDKVKAEKAPVAAKAPAFGKEEGEEEHPDLTHLHAIHGEHAENAVKSAHIYQHEDGTHHLHTHDHKTGAHEHTEHASHEEALSAAKEHLAGAGEHERLEEEAANKLAEAGHGEEAPKHYISGMNE